MLRAASLLAATGFAALTLSACTTTTQSCSNDRCKIDLEGAEASLQMGDHGSTLTLHSASGNTAKVKVGDTEGTLTVGKPQNLNDGTIELVKVEGKDDVEIVITSGSGSSSSTSTTPDSSTP
jgi:hypothetical protein